MKYRFWPLLSALVAAYGINPTVGRAAFVQTNLASDISAMAPVTDPSLVNPWGMAFSTTSPFWVSNQGSNTSTLYTTVPAPAIISPPSPVTVPTGGLGPPTGPTGLVFNSTASSFMIPAPSGTVKAAFLFDTLQGTIEGWNPGSTGGAADAVTVVTMPGAVFTGLTLDSVSGSNYLYAADAVGSIQVFNSGFMNVTGTTFAGKFVDPNPVAGFTPYNAQTLGGDIFVTYAAATSTGAPLPGGYVDEYDSSGNFIRRIATNGPINAPWGLAIAPAGFGPLGGDLLVGNLFNSVIDAYDLSTATPTLVGSITVSTGFTSPVGLWALAFGNGTTGNANTLYFTAGINDQKNGLFGAISFVPEPGCAALVSLALAGLVGRRLRARRK